MKVVIISGSVRNNSESLRVAHFLKKRVKEITELESELIDLNVLRFSVSPDDNYFDKQEPNFKKIYTAIEACDALIIISPEWSGMASPLLKALLIFIGKLAAYKPALLVGVSAAGGGAFTIAELKASGNKNNFITFLPEYLIFRKVGDLLKKDRPETKEDLYMHERSDYAIRLLEAFAKALREIRESEIINLAKYPYGM